MEEFIPCRIMELPLELRDEAAKLAVSINPANAPIAQSPMLASIAPTLLEPGALTLLTGKYWGTMGVDLGVSFLDNPTQGFISKFLLYANLWGTRAGANVRIRHSQSQGEIKLDRGPGGYWSYMGTDILSVHNGPTMNLERFTENTSEAEWERVPVHEVGHSLGFPHEHLRAEIVERIDRNAALEYFARFQGWSARTTQSNVLTPLSVNSIRGTPNAYEDSVMCYSLPAEIMKDRRAVKGGARMSKEDMEFVRLLWPSVVVPPPNPPEPPSPPPPTKPTEGGRGGLLWWIIRKLLQG